MWAPAGLALLARDAAVAREAARSGALAAALATAMALGVWVLLALPATIIGATVAVEALLLPCSLAVMYAVPPLFPAHSSRVFFVALSALSESESVRVRGLRVVRGLAAQLRTLVFGLLAGVGAIALLFSTAPFWLPAATAGFIAVAAVSPFLLPFLAAALFIAFWCTSWVLRRIAAFTILGKISMAAAVVITAGWVVGLISLQSVQMIGEASRRERRSAVDRRVRAWFVTTLNALCRTSGR
jgi:hypothetical protein